MCSEDTTVTTETTSIGLTSLAINGPKLISRPMVMEFGQRAGTGLPQLYTRT